MHLNTTTCSEMPSLETALNALERTFQPPSIENLTCILLKCRKTKSLAYAQRLHAYMRKSGLEAHRLLGNYLLPMLVEAGNMCEAQKVFDKLVSRNEYSWTSLISGYVECGDSQHALNLYQKMQEDCVCPRAHTFVAVLKACARLKDAERGQEVHIDIATRGYERGLVVGNALIDMYAKCSILTNACEVFNKLPVRDVVSWTTLIAAYTERGLGDKALNCFEQMQLEGVSPNTVTYICGLKACGSIGATVKGQELHAEIARKGLLQRDLFVGSTVVDMYAKCGLLLKAQEEFDMLLVRDAISWNSLIAGYANQGLGEEALNCFEQMQLEGISPDPVTFAFSLKACGSIEAIDKGQEIHCEIARKELECELLVGNSLVDMYAKCGWLAKAWEAFDKLPIRDVVSWTALIAGYAKHGLGEQALYCFQQMQQEGNSADSLTFICSLKACAAIGAVNKGQEIHAEVARNGLLERDPFVGNALVDMYAKFGLLAKAWEVFDKLPVQDIVSWNALITGYAHLGESEEVFHTLEKMRETIQPNGVTFLSILTVCSHTGLVDKGQKYFEAMSKEYGITPTAEHHTCMVDLLGRAGQFDEAVVRMKEMPFHSNLVVWHAVLGACRKWGNVDLGRRAFEHAVHLDENDAAAYVLMSNIYADAQLQED